MDEGDMNTRKQAEITDEGIPGKTPRTIINNVIDLLTITPGSDDSPPESQQEREEIGRVGESPTYQLLPPPFSYMDNIQEIKPAATSPGNSGPISTTPAPRVSDATAYITQMIIQASSDSNLDDDIKGKVISRLISSLAQEPYQLDSQPPILKFDEIGVATSPRNTLNPDGEGHHPKVSKPVHSTTSTPAPTTRTPALAPTYANQNSLRERLNASPAPLQIPQGTMKDFHDTQGLRTGQGAQHGLRGTQQGLHSDDFVDLTSSRVVWNDHAARLQGGVRRTPNPPSP